MSIQNEIAKSLKTGQVKANNKAVKKQIKAYNQAENNYINTQKQLTDEQNQQLTQNTEQSILGTRQQMQKQYDYNAINQQVQQDQIAERMADYGLSNSGLNFSQQTAVTTQRMNADNSVMQKYNTAVNTLRSNLQQAIAENNRTLNSNIAGVKLDTQNKIADIRANNATTNAGIITNLRTNAKDLTNKLISNIASTNDKSTNAQSIFAYSKTYGLSDKAIKRLLKMANISWGDYQKWIKNRDFFGDAAAVKSTGKSSSRGSGKSKSSSKKTVSKVENYVDDNSDISKIKDYNSAVKYIQSKGKKSIGTINGRDYTLMTQREYSRGYSGYNKTFKSYQEYLQTMAKMITE